MRAQETTIRRYLDEIEAERKYRQGMQAMCEQVVGLSLASVPKEMSELMKKVMDRGITKLVNRFVSWDQIQGLFIELYGDIYTEEEMEQLIAFAKSPVGKKTLEYEPLIKQRGDEFGHNLLVNNSEEIQALMEETLHEVMGEQEPWRQSFNPEYDL